MTANNEMKASDRELVFNRILNAPRALVFKVWTQPEHVKHWWGPTGFTNTIHQMEVKPGGEWHFIMHGPDGTDYPNKIIFKEVITPERLTYWHGSDDINDPGSFDVSVDFNELGQKTELVMRMTFKSKEVLDQVVEQYGAVEGHNQTMQRLEEYLSQHPDA